MRFTISIFVRPAYWLADTFTNQILDRGIIDGILHFIARIASNVGHIFRNYFDKPVVNGFGDFVGEGDQEASGVVSRSFRREKCSNIFLWHWCWLSVPCFTLFLHLFNIRNLTLPG